MLCPALQRFKMKKPCLIALSMTQCSVPVSLSCALLVKSPQGVVLTRLITPKSPYHMQYCFMVFYYEISIILSADRLQTQPFEFLAQLTSTVPRSRRWAGLCPGSEAKGGPFPATPGRRGGFVQDHAAYFSEMLVLPAENLTSWSLRIPPQYWALEHNAI